jgi:hypothetical protein
MSIDGDAYTVSMLANGIASSREEGRTIDGEATARAALSLMQAHRLLEVPSSV